MRGGCYKHAPMKLSAFMFDVWHRRNAAKLLTSRQIRDDVASGMANYDADVLYRAGSRIGSRSKLEAELDWFDGKLADGRAYVAGDRFSRADLTVASLLANFALQGNYRFTMA